MHFRKTAFIVTLTGCVFLLPSAFAAQLVDFTYTVSSGTAAIIITGYTGSGGSVVIPDTIDNKPVATIGNCAFAGQLSLESILILNSVTSIEDAAFSDCANLTSAFFSGNAPLMGADVFTNCAADFTVYYTAGSSGFTSPAWQGYPSEIFDPACTDTQAPGADTPKHDHLLDYSDGNLDQNAIDRKMLLFYLLQQSRRHK